jgi:hypothetical protein
MNTLHNENIQMLDTSTCFLKEYKTNSSDNITIRKGIPMVFDAVKNNFL